MGESNILAGRVVSAADGAIPPGAGLGALLAEGGTEAGAAFGLSIRPEHLRLGPAADTVIYLEEEVEPHAHRGSAGLLRG